MNFASYFVKGLRNTLRLKKDINWSVKGSEIPIPEATVIDTWFVGEFSSAVYEVVAEYGKNDVEHINLKVSARPEQASLIITGRSNTGKDLVKFTATVDASKVEVIATPFNQEDEVTPLVGVKLTFKVTYFERLTPTYIPTVDGESSSLGGEPGVLQNWKNTNLPDGFIDLDESGSLAISSIGEVRVLSQPTLAADFILSKLNIDNSDGSITITTTPNSLLFSLDNIANLVVNNTFNADTAIVSSFNNVNIGSATPVAGTFTGLTVTSTVTATSNNQSISIAPTGSGTVTINPETTGTINNTTIGLTTPRAMSVTLLGVNGTALMTTMNQIVTLSPIGTGTVTINPANLGSIDNVTIGATTAASGRFTTLTVLNQSTQGNQLITLSQLQAILLGAAA